MGAFFEIIKAVIFGIVEGVTEWLPISSTGHMIVLQNYIPLDVSPGFWKIFEVVIQLGAIMAVVLLFWKKLWPMKTVKGRNFLKLGTVRLWIKIIIACLPAAIVGIALDDFIDEHFYNPKMVAAALIFVGIMFIYIESKLKLANKAAVTKLSEITYKEAFYIGIFQLMAAIFPGTSRSGATIIGGLMLGLSRKVAAEFTFFLAIPVMFGASLLKIVKYLIAGGVAFTGLEVAILIIGTVTAFVVSVFVIGGLMSYIRKKDFTPFGWYRIVVGAVIIIGSIVSKT
ncbi:putative undecaprenyl-diphosphatase UppP [Catonella morbi ATCC 51271]|uniref:Undecaprenyl-diphosphatase n=1 Tax=Catonella morbi ATCC 51271 TaxID=592026 RepID=V2Y3Q9_9FIRM|nr:undecaprenyl-diphosphate phosphatase [Catonella morbi]ESL02722.1 putative undecaprenyl-diphosphatase UppP [Catonella morbi ATCC 51271]